MNATTEAQRATNAQASADHLAVPAAPAPRADSAQSPRPPTVRTKLAELISTSLQDLEALDDGGEGDWSHRLSRMALKRFNAIDPDKRSNANDDAVWQLFEVRALLTGASRVDGITPQRRAASEAAFTRVDALANILCSPADPGAQGLSAPRPLAEGDARAPATPADVERAGAVPPAAALLRKMLVLHEDGVYGADALQLLRDDGALMPGELAVLDALQADDFLGFDYPHQALDAVLCKPENFDVSQRTLDALTQLEAGAQLQPASNAAPAGAARRATAPAACTPSRKPPRKPLSGSAAGRTVDPQAWKQSVINLAESILSLLAAAENVGESGDPVARILAHAEGELNTWVKAARAETACAEGAATWLNWFYDVQSLVEGADALMHESEPRRAVVQAALQHCEVMVTKLDTPGLPEIDQDSYAKQGFMRGKGMFVDLMDQVATRQWDIELEAQFRDGAGRQWTEAARACLEQLRSDFGAQEGFAAALTGYMAMVLHGDGPDSDGMRQVTYDDWVGGPNARGEREAPAAGGVSA